MGRMTLLVCFCLFCAAFSAVAEDRQGCSTTLDGTCAMEEGLEMLQSKATKVTSDTSVDKHEEVEENKQVKQEFEFERSLLQESDVEKVRFRANHEDWVDILDLYKDGYVKRFHDHNAGMWHLNHKNQLVLKWFKWGDEFLESADAGNSFKSAGEKDFTLKSLVQPVWWRQQFAHNGIVALQEQATQAKEHSSNIKEVLRVHANGRIADLDEPGYLAVALLKDNAEMEHYIRRLAHSMKMDIKNEGGLSGLLPYYSGVNTYQTLEKLKGELTKAADAAKGGWITYNDDEDPELALLQEASPDAKKKSSKKHDHHAQKEVKSEKSEMKESDEKIHFRARTQDWIDILDMYKDGFFRRHHGHDVGTWYVNKDRDLVLKWIQWGENHLKTADAGASFDTAGNKKLSLKSLKQPQWWRQNFDKTAELLELPNGAKTARKDWRALIAAHENGRKADLNEKGYLTVAMLKDDEEMSAYIGRLAEQMGMLVVNEGGLQGIVSFYSGVKAYQTLAKLKKELIKASESEAKDLRWCMEKNAALAQIQKDKEEDEAKKGRDADLALLQEQAEGPHASSKKKLSHDVKTHHAKQEKAKAHHEFTHLAKFEKEEKEKAAKHEKASKDVKKQNKTAAKKEEPEFEKTELEESDIEKIRFRAKHDDWIDILDLYKDGFFRRFHDRDVGVWHLNDNQQLVLKWLKWGEEDLETWDDGKSFSKGGNVTFKLKSYVQPLWWKAMNEHNKNNAHLQEQSGKSKKSKKSEEQDMNAIIGAHFHGRNADLTEQGYELLALQKSDEEMKDYIKRVIESMDMVVVNDGGLEGILPYYSGSTTWQTLARLKEEIVLTARKPVGERWVMDQGAEDPSRVA